MTVLHVLTISDDLPLHVFDRMLTATERALLDLGATRIWVDPNLPDHAVMAEFVAPPAEVDQTATDGAGLAASPGDPDRVSPRTAAAPTTAR